jgi:hypothetical protein
MHCQDAEYYTVTSAVCPGTRIRHGSFITDRINGTTRDWLRV